MAKSNKPIFWGLFAAGGTVTAFVTPALVLITLFAAMRFRHGHVHL
jgi:fumarate reductase subunit D